MDLVTSLPFGLSGASAARLFPSETQREFHRPTSPNRFLLAIQLPLVNYMVISLFTNSLGVRILPAKF